MTVGGRRIMDEHSSRAEDGGLPDINLADRFDLTKSPVLLNGAQAVARLLLSQKERDRRAGLNTAGFVTGYRGSPLGGLDLQFSRLAREFKASDIRFEPGLNEELAATALWGAQQAEMRGEGRFDGVFGLWYGKGPGVDRCGDVFRHANLAGTSKHGGVLALMGDDHTAESSTTAHQSEFAFVDVMTPILSPAGVQEILDYGALGWAFSRYAGVWVGLKCIKDTIESTAVVDGSLDRVAPMTPDLPMLSGGLNIRTGDGILAQEERLQEYKRPAMVAWIAANRLNRIIASGGPNAKIGVITLGKSYLDVRQALDELGVDEKRCNDLGLRLYKLGCAWPIEPEGLRQFARGLSLVIVVEEKRSLIEVQLREELYGSADQPVCIGKRDEKGDWLFPVKGALDSNDIAIAIGERLLKISPDAELEARLARLRRAQSALDEIKEVTQRNPYFCSGCPHNRSTVVPEGARAYAGIGCHFMAQYMDRATDGYTQMGGEGANWIGEAPFSTREHVFQNLGDGTYNHSGALALRWAIDTKTNVTYKILFNDAVAMTGGQSHEGGLNVPQIARQVAADGADPIVVVTDDVKKYPADIAWPEGVTIRPREELIEVEEDISQAKGVSVIIYDQTCAAEKRRRRKRGAYPDPDKRVIINELVCEGCGDCGVKSNCVSVQPKDTEFGRKRRIDQSSCNKDFSCIDGFCPSFVTVHGARLKKSGGRASAPSFPEPTAREIGDKPYSIIVTGVGGTGVVTIGAILGMAAHLEGKACGMIDMAGLAQKGGAVFSHVKLARKPEDIHAIRVAAGDADLILGCDLVVSGAKKVLAALRGAETGFVVNSAEVYPGDFTRNPDFSLPGERLRRSISETSGGAALFIDATAAANALVGNSIGANMFLLGYAYQAGYVPLSAVALRRAIELNGEATEMNLAAFAWGRAAFADPKAVAALVEPQSEAASAAKETLVGLVARRVDFLTVYQNGAYAARYQALVAGVDEAERRRAGGATGLAEAVARNLFKLMAYKDEYEVARLYTDGSFKRQIEETFEGDLRLEFHLAPPLLARKDGKTGEARKMRFGPWMIHGFEALAALRFLRGSLFDPFGYSSERREERRLISEYEALCEELTAALAPGNHALALALAALPEKIRGYGHVKARAIAAVAAERERLVERWRSPRAPLQKAAE
jgi:indolepyruvate ferredoxin oxidoreductase